MEETDVMSNQNKNTPANTENQEKKMTKYDRKVQARKAAEAREKRQRKITRITVAVVAAIVVLLAIGLPVGSRIIAKAEYISIGNHSFNKIEYDFLNNFYTSYTKSMYAYVGIIDTTKPLSEQQQSDGVSWQQYFDKMTVENLTKSVAVFEDAKSKGLTYDIAKDKEDFFKSCEDSAKNSSISLSKYLTNNFGAYASKSTLDDVLNFYLTATAHYEALLEQNKPEESEVAKEYVANRINYDTVTYNMLEIASNIADDASEEDIKSITERLLSNAEEIKSKFEGGTSFEELTKEYSELFDKNAEDEIVYEYKDKTSGSISSLYKDWLFDTERKENDITIIEDEDNHSYFIIAFVSRTKPEDTDQNISDDLAREKTDEYIETFVENYPLKDSKNHLNLK